MNERSTGDALFVNSMNTTCRIVDIEEQILCEVYD